MAYLQILRVIAARQLIFIMRFTLSPPSTNVKQMTPRQGLFIMPIFVIAGVALTILWGIPTARNAMQSQKWSSTDGQITTSRVSENQSSSDDNLTYTAKIAYEYTVNDTKYIGSTVAFGDYGSSDPAHAGNIVSRYPVGKSVKVYYNPDDSQTSVLEPGARWSSFMGLIIGIIFSLVGVAGFMISLKKVRQGASVTPLPNIPPSVS